MFEVVVNVGLGVFCDVVIVYWLQEEVFEGEIFEGFGYCLGLRKDEFEFVV